MNRAFALYRMRLWTRRSHAPGGAIRSPDHEPTPGHVCSKHEIQKYKRTTNLKSKYQIIAYCSFKIKMFCHNFSFFLEPAGNDWRWPLGVLATTSGYTLHALPLPISTSTSGFALHTLPRQGRRGRLRYTKAELGMRCTLRYTALRYSEEEWEVHWQKGCPY